MTNLRYFLTTLTILSMCLVSAQDVSLEWASTFKGNSGPTLGNVIISDSEGNTYTAGKFSGNVDFDPGPDSTILTAGFSGTYILKLDPSGNFIWVKKMVGQNITSMIFDVNGNLLLAGYFGGLNDFDPGVNTLSLNSL